LGSGYGSSCSKTWGNSCHARGDLARGDSPGHLARFLLRQSQSRLAGGETDLNDIPADDADAAWTVEFNAHVLRLALERVQPQVAVATWQVFERIWLKDQPALETATALGMTIDAVYAAKSRVLKRLREEVLVLAEDVPQLVPLD